MAKDPAFLFYYQDFLVGTEFMSNQEVGCYIRILCHMADKGRLTGDQMKTICRGDGFADDLKSKFTVDKSGLFYNQRLEKEVEKRRLYSLSRSKNRGCKKKISKSYVQHMENENRNENENKFNEFWKIYPRKKSKGQAEKAWKCLRPDEQLHNRILKAVEQAKTSVEWQDPTYIPYPASWIMAKGWEDEATPLCPQCKNKGKFISSTGYEIICKCPTGNGKA